MRVGAIVPMEVSDGPGREPTWPEMLGFVRHAEELGLDSVWVCDHLWAGWDDKPPENVHEAWTLLPALAASTSRIELGELVSCISFRDPSLLAKMAVTTDEISGGRIVLGLGAGWYDAEYRAFGLPIDHRVARFEEADSDLHHRTIARLSKVGNRASDFGSAGARGGHPLGGTAEPSLPAVILRCPCKLAMVLILAWHATDPR